MVSRGADALLAIFECIVCLDLSSSLRVGRRASSLSRTCLWSAFRICAVSLPEAVARLFQFSLTVDHIQSPSGSPIKGSSTALTFQGHLLDACLYFAPGHVYTVPEHYPKNGTRSVTGSNRLAILPTLGAVGARPANRKPDGGRNSVGAFE
jgi:hypothetical protein